MIGKYSNLGLYLRKLFRSFRNVPVTPDYSHIENICDIQLLPKDKLTNAFRVALNISCPDKKTKGAYLEFGVFNGSSLSCMHIAKMKEGYSDIKLIGIDSFKGLPRGVELEDGGVWFEGQFLCSETETRECLSQRNVDADEYILLSSWFNELDKEILTEELRDRELSVVMIDCDAYSSATSALNILEPFIKSEVVIFFDDWRLYSLDLCNGGEYRAFNEWRLKHPDIKVEKFKSYNWKSEAFILSRI